MRDSSRERGIIREVRVDVNSVGVAGNFVIGFNGQRRVENCGSTGSGQDVAVVGQRCDEAFRSPWRWR